VIGGSCGENLEGATGGAARGTPSALFLQRCDSIGVRGWGCAKDMILWDLVVEVVGEREKFWNGGGRTRQRLEWRERNPSRLRASMGNGSRENTGR